MKPLLPFFLLLFTAAHSLWAQNTQAQRDSIIVADSVVLIKAVSKEYAQMLIDSLLAVESAKSDRLKEVPHYFKLTDTVFNVGDVYIAKSVCFEIATWNMKDSSAKQLDSIADFLKKNSTLIIEIGSHVNYGDYKDEYSTKVATNRARAIKEYLVQKGVKSRVMKVVGYNDTKRPNIYAVTDEEEVTEEERMIAYRMSIRIELKILKTE